MTYLARLVAVLIAISTAPAGANEFIVPLGPNHVMAGGKFSTGGGVTVAMELRPAKDGSMLACGVWARSERLSARARFHVTHRRVLAPSTLAVDGRVVHHNLRVFQQVRASEDYTGFPARCVSTGLRWRENARLDIRITRQVLDHGGFRRNPVIFSRSEDPNPALSAGSVLPGRLTGTGLPTN